MGRGQGDVDVARLTDGFAVVERLDHGELAGPLLDESRDAKEVLGTLRSGGLGPDAVVGVARRADRSIDVDGARLSDHGQGLLSRWIESSELFVPHGIGELAANEEPVTGS